MGEAYSDSYQNMKVLICTEMNRSMKKNKYLEINSSTCKNLVTDKSDILNC